MRQQMAGVPSVCIRVDQRRRRTGDSNPEALAHGGFQVLQSVLRLTASDCVCLRVYVPNNVPRLGQGLNTEAVFFRVY